MKEHGPSIELLNEKKEHGLEKHEKLKSGRLILYQNLGQPAPQQIYHRMLF